METLRKVLEDKEKEIKDAKDQLRQSKEATIREYRDSNARLKELGTSYANSFDDAVCQAKKANPDLDFSQLNIDAQAQATAQPVISKSMEDLFVEDVVPGDEESAPVENRTQPVMSVSLRMLKRTLKKPPSVITLFFFFVGIVPIWGTAF